MGATFQNRPRRILGCLEDSLGSLLALLACPEICDYMPVNPKLLEREIIDIARGGGVDGAILSKESLNTLGPKLTALGIEVIDWDSVFGDALRTKDDQSPASGNLDAWPNRPGRLILHTSGTTGAPKRVPVSIEAMMRSARNIAKHHELQSDDLALNTLPTFHIGAVVDVLLAPFYAGGTVALTDDRSPQALAKAIREVRPTWVQLVPTILMHLIEKLDEQELKDLGSSLRFIRNISAPVPEHLRTRAEQLFGCPIIEMYGMTDTAGQITTNGRAPQDRSPGTVGRETAVSIKILDQTGAEVGQGRRGEICVSGPTVFDGYEGVAREDVFFGNWFRTGDLGVFDENGFLSIRGRIKEMINIGGEKVAPSEIEKIALTHPDVKEAAAYAIAHETLGEVSGLTIAVRCPIDETDLRNFMARSLTDFKRPRRFRQVAELPRLPNAKVDRLRIARQASAEVGQTPDKETSLQYPKNSIEKKVAELWCLHLKSPQPEGADDFFDMGGDSLSATGFLIDLSKTLGQTVSPTQLFATPTFEGIVAALSNEAESEIQPQARSIDFVAQKMAGWPGQVALQNGLFRGIGTIQNGAPLFWCCQNVREVNLVRETIAVRRPLYVVRSLFRLSGKTIFHRNKRSSDDFAELTQILIKEINAIQPEGEICLGGFCGGGLVMQHLVRAIVDAGRQIKLFVSWDFWPTIPIPCPVIHGMSTCPKNSARIMLQNMDVSLPVLHPEGCEVLEIDAGHNFTAEHCDVVSKRIVGLLDATTIALAKPGLAPNDWTYEERLRPPRVKIISHALPRFYVGGASHRFEVSIKNASDRILDPFERSGLGFDMTLYNLDGWIRNAYAGFGPLTEAVEPGGIATLQGEIRFPDKMVPMLLKGRFVSHGVAFAEGGKVTTLKKIVLPNLRRSKKAAM